MANPYEIRLDVLKLAREILERNQDVEMSNSMNANPNVSQNLSASSASLSSTSVASVNFTRTYNTDDVLACASKLYEFVKDTDKK